MVTTAEISMYPLQEDYRDLIREFLAQLRTCQDLRVTTGPTSTVVVGEHKQLMEHLTDLLDWSCREQGQSVFIAKLLPGYDTQTRD